MFTSLLNLCKTYSGTQPKSVSLFFKRSRKKRESKVKHLCWWQQHNSLLFCPWHPVDKENTRKCNLLRVVSCCQTIANTFYITFSKCVWFSVVVSLFLSSKRKCFWYKCRKPSVERFFARLEFVTLFLEVYSKWEHGCTFGEEDNCDDDLMCMQKKDGSTSQCRPYSGNCPSWGWLCEE